MKTKRILPNSLVYPMHKGKSKYISRKKQLCTETLYEEMDRIPLWRFYNGQTHKLRREFRFINVNKAKEFVKKINNTAKDLKKDPILHILNNTVKIELYTHSIQGICEEDLVMASKIDDIYFKFN